MKAFQSSLISTLLLINTTYAFLPTNRLNIVSPNTRIEPSSALLYSDSSSDDESKFSKDSRWSSLSPSVKKRIIDEAQGRAIRNKKKNEPAAEKKRRMMMHYKKAQSKAKRDSRVTRPLALNSPDRVELSELVPNEIYNGTVISFTSFGAYVDIGSKCDGLLHVSQITRERFVEHPKQVLSPGMEIDVKLVRVSPELNKMQLTMLPMDVLSQEMEDEDEIKSRIPLTDIDVDDELWGEIKRVTAFGAYVELGTAVQGWLHFMDHPSFGNVPGAEPSEFMKIGDRIRCWVSNVDMDLERLKLTSNRPEHLPGPRREIRKYVTDNE
mmetsp:Transcript_3564/g.4712  ORF Transcript_3564/g.4712 Transcript_3564/m.4712 type:complete len:324 (+) Transcript_3564:438-1409(+)